MALGTVISVLLLAVGTCQGDYQYGNYGNPSDMGRSGQPPSPPISRSNIKCTLDAPCYHTMLNVVMDGKQGFNPDVNGFRRHFDLVGLSDDQVIQLARKALKWYKDEYGLTFEMTDVETMTGNLRVPSTDGKASIFAYHGLPSTRYRVYTAKVGDQIQLMNAPMSGAGWTVRFTDQKDYVSTGRRNMTIPGSASLLHGYYIIQPCVNQPAGHCQNIINPGNPTDNIMIQYETDAYFQNHQGGAMDFSVLHATMRSDLLGVGHGLGYYPMRNSKKRLVQGWLDIVFTTYPYPYGKY